MSIINISRRRQLEIINKYIKIGYIPKTDITTTKKTKHSDPETQKPKTEIPMEMKFRSESLREHKIEKIFTSPQKISSILLRGKTKINLEDLNSTKSHFDTFIKLISNTHITRASRECNVSTSYFDNIKCIANIEHRTKLLKV